MVEASQAFGATDWQTLLKIQLPLARPTIVVGINQTTMMALAMVVVASMIGAKGLGMEVLLAINRIEVGRGFEAGLSIVFLAIIIDRITYALATRGQSQ
jgi:glycine betaine/proline transport system permease protein